MQGLDVLPFRALRFDPARVRALAAVTSPPYDVVEPAGVGALEALESHNVVRLILPQDDAGPHSRYERAAERLRGWREDRTVTADPDPAFYVYEQLAAGTLVRGVIASVALGQPGDGVVRPHEDVVAAVVDDRAALLAATRANLEPVLLVHTGSTASSAALQRVVDATARRPPLVDATTADGHRHRLWRVLDRADQAAVRGALAERRAVIADGHHRWAASVAHERTADAGPVADGPRPWARTLALLVDAERYPLRLAAIHRVVADLDLDRALGRLGPDFSVRRAPLDVALAQLSQDAPPRPDSHGSPHDDGLAHVGLPARVNGFVLADADGAAVVTLRSGTDRAAAVGARSAVPTPAGRRPLLDTALLHSYVLPQRWHVEEARTSYWHEVAGALEGASLQAGTAVLLRPVLLEEVLAATSLGLTLPRKTTSFGPKPRSGLVMRAFDLPEPTLG